MELSKPELEQVAQLCNWAEDFALHAARKLGLNVDEATLQLLTLKAKVNKAMKEIAEAEKAEAAKEEAKS